MIHIKDTCSSLDNTALPLDAFSYREFEKSQAEVHFERDVEKIEIKFIDPEGRPMEVGFYKIKIFDSKLHATWHVTLEELMKHGNDRFKQAMLAHFA